MIPVRQMIPPLTTRWAAERPTAPRPVHSITTYVRVDIGGLAGVVVRAERLDEIALWALGRQVNDIHVIPPLHPQ